MAEKAGHRFVERGAYKGRGLAVFTSGGDSQVRILFILYIMYHLYTHLFLHPRV